MSGATVGRVTPAVAGVARPTKPILFSAPMVRALLDGSKTQTRRVVKLNASGRAGRGGRNWHLGDPDVVLACPYGQPGDRLWVRETWARDDEDGLIMYRASRNEDTLNWESQRHESGHPRFNWKPSIFMPRWASRITLEITGSGYQRDDHKGLKLRARAVRRVNLVLQ